MKTMTSVSTFGALTEIHVNPHKLTGEWVLKMGYPKIRSLIIRLQIEKHNGGRLQTVRHAYISHRITSHIVSYHTISYHISYIKYIHIYIYIYITYIYIYIYIHTYMHTHTYIYIYIYIEIHTYTHIYIYRYIPIISPWYLHDIPLISTRLKRHSACLHGIKDGRLVEPETRIAIGHLAMPCFQDLDMFLWREGEIYIYIYLYLYIYIWTTIWRERERYIYIYLYLSIYIYEQQYDIWVCLTMGYVQFVFFFWWGQWSWTVRFCGIF